MPSKIPLVQRRFVSYIFTVPFYEKALWDLALHPFQYGFWIKVFGLKSKSNLHYTRRFTPKRVTSGGAHPRGLAPGQHSSEETWQWWQADSATVLIWQARDSNPKPPARLACALSNWANGLEKKCSNHIFKFHFYASHILHSEIWWCHTPCLSKSGRL